MNFKNKYSSKILYLLVMASAIVTIWFAKQTATSGGEVRHTEIRDASANGQIPNSGGNEEIKKEGDY